LARMNECTVAFGPAMTIVATTRGGNEEMGSQF